MPNLPKNLTDPSFISVLYTCHECGLKEQPVPVQARTTEDVVEWMKTVQEMVSADHAMRNPFCFSRACDLKIPMPAGTQKVGGLPEH